MKHHLIITGTGRSGTTLLVQLFGALGLEIGFNLSLENNPMSYFKSSRCGLEWHYIKNEWNPYVLKSPAYCDKWEDIFFDSNVVIDHVYIGMRDITAAAESRRAVAAQCGIPVGSYIPPGGLDGTDSMEQGVQELILMEKNYRLLLNLSETQIPVTLIRFPRMANDPEYLYQKINTSLPDNMSFDLFKQHFNEIVNIDYIHQFSGNDL